MLKNNSCGIKFCNRAFKYGDALFETVRIFDGKIPFLEDHFERLSKGMRVLNFVPSPDFNSHFFKEIILKDLISRNAKVRVTVFRSGQGLYTPENNNIQWFVETFPLPLSYFEWHEQQLSYCIYDEVLLSYSILSGLKTTNSLPYILASIHRKKQQKDEVLLLNNTGNISEAASSNIFVWHNNTLLTPSLKEACLEGVMRKHVIKLAQNLDLVVQEKAITLEMLSQSQEIFVTNSVQGIRRLESPNNDFHMTKIIYDALNELISNAKQ